MNKDKFFEYAGIGFNWTIKIVIFILVIKLIYVLLFTGSYKDRFNIMILFGIPTILLIGFYWGNKKSH